MSSHSRFPRFLSSRIRITVLAVATVAAVSVSVGVPSNAAFAETGTPQARIAYAIQHDTLAEELHSGTITQADVDTVIRTGLDFQGRHFSGLNGITAADEEAARTAPPVLAEDTSPADPSLAAPVKSGGDVSAPDAAPATNAGIGESKSISGIWHWFHTDHWYYINGKWLMWMAAVPIAVATASFCRAIISSVSEKGVNVCAVVVILMGIALAVIHDTACARYGWHVNLPDVRKSYCGRG